MQDKAKKTNNVSAKQADKKQKLAAALRQNLLRRKKAAKAN